MDIHTLRKFIVDSKEYDAVQFTGFGPADQAILLWIQDKTRRPSINTNRGGILTPGLVYDGKDGVYYLACGLNAFDTSKPKKIKPGKWVVWNDVEGIDLLKNLDFQDKFVDPDRKARQEKINRYIPIEESDPVRAVKMTKDSVQEVLTLFDDQKVCRYTVDLEGHVMNLWFSPEPGVEIEWNINFDMWCVRNAKTFTWMTNYAFEETFRPV